MTREEAAIILDGFKNNPLFSDTHAQAFDMAISALSENNGNWIPVSDRLPDDHDWYVIVVKEKSTGYQCIPRIAMHHSGNHWAIIDTENADKEWLDDLECIAWMPLPEPYKADREVSE